MKVEVASQIEVSGRVRQLMGLFDVPFADRAELSWQVPDELAGVSDREDWQIGLVLGPSGSGKTTIAKALWPNRYLDPHSMSWPTDRAVVDAIDAPIRETTRMLTAVGFGSPPAWLRPFHVLSTGEQFRVELARALLEQGDPVIDEFTSVVDRQVAQYGSATTQKIVRAEGRRLVAITCHFDVIEWLSPDWVYRPDTGVMEWPRGSLQRPAVELEVRGVSREAWPVFRPHHYLSADLHVAAHCLGAFIEDECVAFCAYYRFPHPRAKNIMLISRLVVLPDYQGLGIGGHLLDFTGQLLAADGERTRITTSHPAMIAALRASPRWEASKAANAPSRSKKPKRLVRQHASTRKLATRAFEYVPV